MQWRVSVPIFRNTVILKQLGLALGLPFSLVALIITFTSGRSVYTLYALGLIGALLFLTWLFIRVVYDGTYDVEYILDDQGVLCCTQARQAKKNRVINALTVILGLLSGKPAAAGAGMLAQARQEVFLKWNRVRRITYKPQSRSILLRGGWMENIALFCTEENYRMAEQAVKDRIQHLKKEKREEHSL
ncbi:MAG: hypothetical protein RBT41_06835 [Clostridia bacterium]|nr:hypothetical protein [Clostridia bacterium]